MFSCVLCNTDEMLPTMFWSVRKQRTLCECSWYPLWIKAAPVLRGVLLKPFVVLQQRNRWTMKKNISAPLKVWLFLFKQYNTSFGTYCWHSNTSASKKLWEMSNLWSYGWLVEGFFPPLQQASVKNRASRKFLATSQQSRRKLYPTLPLGLNEIYSLWASFNLVFQIAKPVKEGS